MLSKKTICVLTFLSIFFYYNVYSQDQVAILPVSNPSHLQLKILANGKSLNSSKTFDIADKQVEIKAFPIGNDAGKELVIPEIEVDLVRGGRLIATEKMGEKGDLTQLLKQARSKDIIRFMVSGVYFMNAMEKLELYSLGTVNLLYSIVENRHLVMD